MLNRNEQGKRDKIQVSPVKEMGQMKDVRIWNDFSYRENSWQFMFFRWLELHPLFKQFQESPWWVGNLEISSQKSLHEIRWQVIVNIGYHCKPFGLRRAEAF